MQPNSCMYREDTSTRLLTGLHVWTRKFNLQTKIFATDHTSPFHVQVTVQRDKILIIKTNQMKQLFKFIFGIKLYMFRTVPLSIIRSFSLYIHTAMVYVIQVCWQVANRIRTDLQFQFTCRYRCFQCHGRICGHDTEKKNCALFRKIKNWQNVLNLYGNYWPSSF